MLTTPWHSLHGNKDENDVCANKSHVSANVITTTMIGIIAPNMY